MSSGPSPALLRYAGWWQTSLDVVAVRIEHITAVVVGVVDGANAWGASPERRPIDHRTSPRPCHVGIILASPTGEFADEAAGAPTATLLPALDPTPMGWKNRDWFLGIDPGHVFDSADGPRRATTSLMRVAPAI